MFLSEILDNIIQEAGQFIIGDLSCFGWSKEKFLNSLVINELKFYERYRPLTFRFNRRADQLANGQASLFFSNKDSTGAHDGSQDAGLVFNQRVGELNRDPGLVPEWISSVIPVNVLTTAGILYLIQETRFINTSERSILHEPRTFLWHYEHDDNHGILYTSETGKMDITAHYKYPVIDMVDSNGNFVDAEIKYLDAGKDEIFLDIILGRFLVSVGRSRRLATLNNSPINFDAAELVSEGTEMMKEARERLYEQSQWWSAIGT
jgi:hypothetical protein